MGKTKPACQSPKERLSNNREVSLGFTKKVTIDEAHRCPQCAQPVCLSGCPLGVDIPGFIRFLREGDAVSALERIKQSNPLPAICGRICPAPCESACIFYEEGSPIAIRALERYAADFGSKPHSKAKPIIVSKDKSIAIVGSGPSAMAAASVMLKEGFRVVMFEAANEAGGVLRYGIPQFRLPAQVLDAQFEELQSQGLELHTNVLIGRMKSLEELIHEFDAVLLALGASLPNYISLPGENLAGVYYAEEFLMRLQILSKENILSSASSVLRGTQTLVVGGGYAALDAARVAVRLGQQVQWIFRGMEEEMGISGDDLKESLEEGITVQAPFEVLRIEGDPKGYVTGVQARHLEIVEGLGGLSLQPSKENPTVWEAQNVIIANGQRPNSFLAKTFSQLRIKDNGTLWVNEDSGMTSIDKVFAAAAVVQGSMTVVEALASGKKIALQISKFLTHS